MEQTFQIRDEFIKLGQLLKAADLASSGAQAKDMIQNGEVLVNGGPETRRGRKLYPGDAVSVRGETVRVTE